MSNMFGKAAPPPAPPATMPSINSAEVLAARRRAAEMTRMRAGRASTILTGPDSGAGGGGDSYSSKTLG